MSRTAILKIGGVGQQNELDDLSIRITGKLETAIPVDMALDVGAAAESADTEQKSTDERHLHDDEPYRSITGRKS